MIFGDKFLAPSKLELEDSEVSKPVAFHPVQCCCLKELLCNVHSVLQFVAFADPLYKRL